MHKTFPQFWKCYERLPFEVQRVADAAFLLLKDNPRHPSLHFKPIGRFHSARVGLQYRALAIEKADDFYWFWIGHHDEYDRILDAGD